jgi:hypothetical protein
MKIAFVPGIVALALGTWAGAAPVAAQTPICPPGYYYASDGRCYPGGPPAYPPPVYEVAPPVYQPPVVFDGLVLGLGLGALIGGEGRGGEGRGGEGRGGERGGGRGRR